MTTLHFLVLIIFIILSGILIGIIAGIVSRKQNKNITKSFCDTNHVFYKFTDQNEVSIDKVVEHFKLLNF